MHCTLFIYFVARMMISRAHRSTQLRYERNRTKLSLRGDGARQTQPKSPVATGKQAQGETTLNHASDFPFLRPAKGETTEWKTLWQNPVSQPKCHLGLTEPSNDGPGAVVDAGDVSGRPILEAEDYHGGD